MTVVPKEVKEAWKGVEGNFYCEENTLRTTKDVCAYAEGKPVAESRQLPGE